MQQVRCLAEHDFRLASVLGISRYQIMKINREDRTPNLVAAVCTRREIRVPKSCIRFYLVKKHIQLVFREVGGIDEIRSQAGYIIVSDHTLNRDRR